MKAKKGKNSQVCFFVLWIKIHTAAMGLFSCINFNGQKMHCTGLVHWLEHRQG